MLSEGAPASTPMEVIAAALRRLAPNLPGSVRFRLINSLEHFDRASLLLEGDREMAAFRAIRGEEEAAAALIKAIQLRRYPHAREFNARDHQHKAAIVACVMAVANQVSPMMRKFQLTFDHEKRRADVRVPLSNFGVEGGELFSVQPVEPLDLIYSGEKSEAEVLDNALSSLAQQSNFENIRRMVSAQANSRNTLLYASDSSVPLSDASSGDIENRRNRAFIVLVLCVMVLQSRKHQSLVLEAIRAFLRAISGLPAVQATGGGRA